MFLLIKKKNIIFVMSSLITLFALIQSGCESFYRKIIDQISPSTIFLPSDYKLRIVDIKYFDVNYIDLNEKLVVDTNIEKIGWNKVVICYIYNLKFKGKKGFGYIDVKTGKITNIDSENDVVTIPEKFSKIKYYTPKELYLEKEKKLNGEWIWKKNEEKRDNE